MELTDLRIPTRVLDTNARSPLQFQLSIQKLVQVPFTCQEVTLPDLQGPAIEQPTPFTPIKSELGRIQFGALQIIFKVDEHLFNYKELYRWLMGTGIPGGYEQYQEWAAMVRATNRREIEKSDATLTILNSNNRAILRYRFPDIFPVSLGQLGFNTTDTTVEYLTCTASFAVTLFEIVDLRATL